MGWKTVKERFNIEHIVQVRNGGICIGSPYISDIAVIDIATGVLTVNPNFLDLFKGNRGYPALVAASPEELLSAIRAADTFAASVPVFSYERGEIVEQLCEEFGWPHATHDGSLMHTNSHFLAKSDAVRAAKRDAELRVRLAQEQVERYRRELAEAEKGLAECEAELAELAETYPASCA